MSIVSSVLSRVSSRSRSSSGWKINVRLASLMDSIFAIGFGLGLRFVVDAVSHHDFKLTGTLVGLWEGVIMLHFLKKMPKSFDPFIAYSVRLFVDFLYTESLARLVLVIIWTVLGMVLADVTPAIWSDVGLNRIWRRFRRDLYTTSQMIPTVAFFPPPRTVRFSPSREPSIIVEEPSVLSPSIITTEQTPTSGTVPPTTITPVTREIFRRRVPGHFHLDYSDTETELSFSRAGPSNIGRTSRRLSVFPGQQDFNDGATDLSSLNSQNDDDADEGNLSSGASSSGETERAGPSSSALNISEIQDMEEQEEQVPAEELQVDIAAATAVKDEEGNRTPTLRPVYMPPTPSDSAAHWRLNRDRDLAEPLPIRPLSEMLPQIPDFLEEPTTEDWEKIEPIDYDKPPTPPAKDDLPSRFKASSTPPQQQNRSTPSPEGWDAMESQFLSRHADAATHTEPTTNANDTHHIDAHANDQRLSVPPPYKNYEDFDDIYGDYPEDNKQPTTIYDSTAGAGATGDLLGAADLEPVPGASAAWGDILESRRTAKEVEAKRLSDEAEEAVRQRQIEEEQARLKAEEDVKEAAEAQKKKVEEAEAQRQAEISTALAATATAEEAEKEKERLKDERKKRKAEEKQERKLKEEADVLARQKKREEEEVEKKRLEEEAEAKAEEERKNKEAIAQRKKEAAEAEERRQKAAKDEADRKEKEEEEKKQQQEAEQKKKQEEKEREEREKDKKERAGAEKAGEGTEKTREEEEAHLIDAAIATALEIQQQEDADSKAKADKAAAPADARRVQEAEAQTKDAEAKRVADAAANSAKADQLAAAGDLPVSEGFNSPEPLVVPDDPAATEPPAPAPAPEAYEESVISQASEAPPSNVMDRVERMLTLRAQMVQVQAQIDNLKAGGADSSNVALKQEEKVMRKMQRQAQRRYAAGIPLAQYLDDFEDSDVVTMEGLDLKTAEQKMGEKLESLMAPTSKSLQFKITVTVPKKAKDAQKPKIKVLEFIEMFNLAPYTKENPKTKKISEFVIDISEEKFAPWLSGYRALLAKREQEAEEPNLDSW